MAARQWYRMRWSLEIVLVCILFHRHSSMSFPAPHNQHRPTTSTTSRSVQNIISWRPWGFRRESSQRSSSATAEAVGNRSKEVLKAEKSAVRPSPVHLIQKETETLTREVAEDNNHVEITEEASEQQERNSNKGKNATQTTQVNTYTHPLTKLTYKSLHATRPKFEAYLSYLGISDPEIITSKTVTVTAEERAGWRDLWSKGQLVTDRTELLAVYPSDDDKPKGSGENDTAPKRGGFLDLLSLYADRLTSILQDEKDDLQSSNPNQLLDWLDEHYSDAQNMRVANVQSLSIDEQLKTHQQFLDWFRDNFPYYYDRCQHCNASMKEDIARRQNEKDTEENSEDEDPHQTFVGYVCPTEAEKVGKAGRTELYQCHECRQFTRFPRYNAASYVVEHKRGRCGEYSMLLFRFLRAMGHDCRWVIDWADHVWAEVWVSDRWVHLDPCEAAVDNNYLYQEWGKKQTYIIGFCAPPLKRAQSDAVMEDVTTMYTTDSWGDISERRDLDDIAVRNALAQASTQLEAKLVEMMGLEQVAKK